MEEAAELAGFFAAHAVWSIAEGEVLVPIYGLDHAEKGRAMERLALESLEDAVDAGKLRLATNPHDALRGVFIYDGRITAEVRKVDALIVEFRDFDHPHDAIVVAVPYLPGKVGRRFVVGRPAVLRLPEHLQETAEEIFEAFFRGVESHEKGAEVWERCLGEIT